jgi:hypothetical protein
MTDTRRTNFEKIAVVETATPVAYTEGNYYAVIRFGDKEFQSMNSYATADSARRQSRKIVQAIQMACKGKKGSGKGGGKGK